jgi:hypothetical protein
MADAVIKVDGLNDLLRAFAAADKALKDDLRDALQEAAAPIRSDAQALAGSSIRNNTTAWSRMRVGIERGGVVYVAPVERGIKGRGNQRLRRRRFADLLRDRAMHPARQRNIRNVERRLEQMLLEVKAVWERHG